MSRWFSISWWQYIFETPSGSRKYCSMLEKLWCRIKFHPQGVIYHNMGGLEPDMHCKNCGDNLG